MNFFVKAIFVIIIGLIFGSVSCIFDILISKYIEKVIQKVRYKYESHK